MDIELKMPDLATTDSPMRVVRWLKQVGAQVKRGEPILEVETDKSTMELEAIAAGTLKALHVRPDDAVTVGQPIATLAAEGAAASVSPGGAPAPAAAAPPEGKGGMFSRNRSAATEPRSGTDAGSIPLSAAQREVARRLQVSKQTVPHYYLQASANAEPLIARRKSAAPTAVVWDAFFAHAAAKALARYERMGFRFEGDRLSRGTSDAIGVAVDHEGDLFVIPLLEPASKTPEILSVEIRAAVEGIRSGDPGMRRLQPARFTITNLGSTGVDSFAAIVNPPEAAILAIGRIAPASAVADGRVVAQNRVSLTLSVDHRVANGKYAAQFLQAIVQELEAF